MQIEVLRWTSLYERLGGWEYENCRESTGGVEATKVWDAAKGWKREGDEAEGGKGKAFAESLRWIEFLCTRLDTKQAWTERSCPTRLNSIPLDIHLHSSFYIFSSSASSFFYFSYCSLSISGYAYSFTSISLPRNSLPSCFLQYSMGPYALGECRTSAVPLFICFVLFSI